MKKEKAMEWVKALRSGNYQQGKGGLKFIKYGGEITYCCLGVLGEISGINTKDLEEYRDFNTREMREKADIYRDTGSNKNGSTINLKVGDEVKSFFSLADANDSGATFEEIADWVEKNYELL
jgi:hypothetical protein